MTEIPERTFQYEIDAQDRICLVSDAWLKFAQDNGAYELTREAVVGTLLWDSVADGETKHLYEMLFAKVRRTGVSSTIPFRCDSPDCRRHMALTIARAPGGALVLTGRLVREERRSSMALLDSSVERSREMATVCSWCKRMRMTSDVWVELEEAISSRGLFDSAPMPRITHGICGECTALLEGELSD
jgi:hypothetical protein